MPMDETPQEQQDEGQASQQAVFDRSAIEEKWRQRWDAMKAFEAEPDEKPKFFLTFPYPYVNGYLHVGHFYTLMRIEALARYKRMRGFNVLFPQAWHCTGSPIENAAKRVREGEETQINILKGMGFADDAIRSFADPVHWVDYFPKEASADFHRMGISFDKRRQFITTELNPHYDRFIRWQFRRLQEKGYVVKGKHPVIWCTTCNSPVSDHSRLRGEGETPQEFTLLKFAHGDGSIIAASLRPETVYGQTNMWVNPDIEYVRAQVSRPGKPAETWYVSRQCADKLSGQDYEVSVSGTVPGKEFIGKECLAPGIDRKIPILPSTFCDPSKGTGFVTSVPSDSPDDWMGLEDLKRDESFASQYGLKSEDIRKIDVIPIISSKELGDLPAKKVCEELGITSQRDREKLEEARKIVYKKGFYTGRMTERCGAYAGMPVEEAKEKIKAGLVAAGKADIMFEPSGDVVCRCLTPSVVRIVRDQWFLAYGDAGWKERTKEALKHLALYPEKARPQFEYVLDWLNDWACTREQGLGTRLPWDERWVIDSLSDSTIYMAYYTIAHILKTVPAKKVDDALFDYVLLGKGEAEKLKAVKRKAEKMRRQFMYYYPVDFRNSGKDLVQNHLAFYLFNHTAIFPQEQWPRGIGVNGFVTVDGEKMSKSVGNIILLRDMAERFGADASRFTILQGGEGLDDANWDSELARNMGQKLEEVYHFAASHYKKGRRKRLQIDGWLDSQVARIVADTTSHIEATQFRSALQRAYFDMQNCLRWYLRRVEIPHSATLSKALETQLLLLAPFSPFVCEETWERLGKRKPIILSSWPEPDMAAAKPELDAAEDFIRLLNEDVKTVIMLSKLEKPKEVLVFMPAEWKYALFGALKPALGQTKSIGELMPLLMKDEALREHGQDISRMLPSLVKEQRKVSSALPRETELLTLKDAAGMLRREFGCEVTLVPEEKSKEQKARAALPGKPALLVR